MRACSNTLAHSIDILDVDWLWELGLLGDAAVGVEDGKSVLREVQTFAEGLFLTLLEETGSRCLAQVGLRGDFGALARLDYEVVFDCAEVEQRFLLYTLLLGAVLVLLRRRQVPAARCPRQPQVRLRRFVVPPSRLIHFNSLS